MNPTPLTIGISCGGELHGTLRVPGDKSISHRAVLLAALAEGTSEVTGLSTGGDVHCSLEAIRQLGAGVVHRDGSVLVDGGRSRLSQPNGPIDLGNSGTGMRLLIGLLASLPFDVTLTGDSSLSSRPMDRVAVPLGRMGARVSGSGAHLLPPVVVSGGGLRGIDYTPPMASAQVKSAVLLAGLDASGETTVHEPVRTRAHTEELLEAMGADITVTEGKHGRSVRVRRSELRPTRLEVPGDPSQAAFWLVGAAILEGSAVTVTDLYLGPERDGFLGVLRRMGAAIEVRSSEGHRGSVSIRSSPLRGTTVHPDEIPSLDEVPVLAVAASVAEGVSRFCDVGELRFKESDRLVSTARMVSSFGGDARIDGDDLVITGVRGLRSGGTVDPCGDHRIAMAAAIASMATSGGTTTITGWESVATSYPGFLDDLKGLRGTL